MRTLLSAEAEKTKRIPLTRGKFTLIDHGDYSVVSRFKWYAREGANGFYAARQMRIHGGRQSFVYLHRFVLAAPPDREVDHINGDTLDNRRVNLRLCDRAGNCRNSRVRSIVKTSRFKGVHLHKLTGKWRAMIHYEGKQMHLGLFHNEIDAAKAYDSAALRYFGEFACINFPELIGSDNRRA